MKSDAYILSGIALSKGKEKVGSFRNAANYLCKHVTIIKYIKVEKETGLNSDFLLLPTYVHTKINIQYFFTK